MKTDRFPLAPARDERFAAARPPLLDELVDDPFSRAAGAPLIHGNSVRLLKDATENYPAWLEAIRSAERHVHFETYFICDDDVGREFALGLMAKARDGVAVRLVYDWFGNLGKTSRRFWRDLRGAGVELRCYNPPRLESPFGWLNRDHRKMLAVDGRIAFVTGLCVGGMWTGDPSRNIEPWRDTGVEIRGRAVAEIERNFAKVWALLGEPIPSMEALEAPRAAGNVDMRIVATEPSTAGMLRVDQLVAALASSRLWLTDAYYAGMTTYVQALRAAAEDGIDVRLLVPHSTDVPLLRPISRSGYRPLLEAGVRVFEWNGTMLHAKSAVADGAWSRVGSTNLNIASWLGNCELDAVIEDREFADEMEQMYLEDLDNSTEVVLSERLRTRAAGSRPRRRHPRSMRAHGSASRAAASAMRLGNAVGAAFSDRRALGPVEAQVMTAAGLSLCGLAVFVAFFPRVLAYPLSALGAWAGVSLLYRGYKLRKGRDGGREAASRAAARRGESDEC